MTILPSPFWASSLRVVMIELAAAESSPEVGSSKIMILGSAMRPMPTLTLLLSPPLMPRIPHEPPTWLSAT